MKSMLLKNKNAVIYGVADSLAGEFARVFAYQQVQNAGNAAADAGLQLKSSLSTIEDVDLAAATVSLKTQQVAYQAALAATSKTIQPSLLDFLH